MRLPSPYDRLLLPVYVPSLLMAVSQEALTILLPLYMLELGATPAFAALVVGLRGIGILLFDVPAGMLVARFGDKPVLLGGLALILAGLLTLGFTANPWALGLAAVALGSGHAAWMLGRQSYLADICATARARPRDRRDGGLAARRCAARPGRGRRARRARGLSRRVHRGRRERRRRGARRCCCSRAPSPPHRGARRSRPRRDVARARRLTAACSRRPACSALVLQLMRATRQLLVPLFGQAAGLDVSRRSASRTRSAPSSTSRCSIRPACSPTSTAANGAPCRAWLLYAAGLALLPFASGFYSLLAAAVLLGFANGIGTGVVMIIGADLARASGRQGQFLGLWRLIGDVGISLAPLLAGVLVDAAGLAAASLVVAASGWRARS